MMRVLKSVWIWGITAALILAWIPLMAVVSLADRSKMRLHRARWFRRLGPLVAKANPAWRLHVAGLGNFRRDRAYVFVANHQSLADIPLISHLRQDSKWLGKAELFRIPVFGWFMRLAGDVAVDRSDRRKAAQALLKCASYLRQGCSVVFFPEGTRSRDGQILPFNDGPFQLAMREQVPVVPVVVEGTGNALPRSSWLFNERSDMYLHVLPPIAPEGWKNPGELRDAVRQRMIDELETLRGCKLHT
jgi:1-acyl-sn-glycerol-3-phosphate acyltransferase